MKSADTTDKVKALTEADWTKIAEFAVSEQRARAERRKNLEKIWKEVDRQVDMIPIPRVDAQGKPLSGTEWMPELELPLQAQALEVLMADCRRLMFADDRNFFSAHPALEDDVLQALEQDPIIPGLSDQNRTLLGYMGRPNARVDQSDLDAVVEGMLTHYHSLYDFRGHLDRLNAEALKYGAYVGRARMVRLEKFSTDYRGVYDKSLRIPALIPRSIRSTYLDDTCAAVMNEGVMVAPLVIESYSIAIAELNIAASKGSKDPESEDGGWMPDALKGLEPERNRTTLECLEMEGDIVVPQDGPGSIFLPGVIVSVAIGRVGNKTVPRVFRFRLREFPFNSYIAGTYQRTDVKSPYGTGPLMIGSPVHKAATEALNQLMALAMLHVRPPMSWNPDDHHLMAQGGPVIEPGASNPGRSEVKAMRLGEMTPMSTVYQALVRQYEDLTGVTAPRLGGQTKSHQTAFAVDSEIARGVIRTVDFVRTQMEGPLPTFLSMEYEMCRKSMKGGQMVYVPKLDAWLKLSDRHLPKNCSFDVHGAAGPLEEREKQGKKSQALQSVLAIEPMVIKLGGKPLNYDEIRKRILTDGGWHDVERFTEQPQAPADVAAAIAGAAPVPGLPGGDQVVPGATPDPLAALAPAAAG